MNCGSVALRALEPTDLDLLYRWENDANLWAASDTIAPYSRQLLWQYLENYTGDIYKSRQLRLVITSDAEPVGTVDFFNFDPMNNRAELGLYVAEQFRGTGLGQTALRLACDYAQHHVGMKQIYVYIRTDNTVCMRLFTHYGFTQSGLLRSWVKRGHNYHDVALLQLIFA